MRRMGLILFASLILAACSAPRTPLRTFEKGEEVAYYDFTEINTFEDGTYGNGTVRLQIGSGVYQIAIGEGDNEIWFGQWGEPLRDVVIEVNARQTTESEDTVYGVMCRMRGSVGLRPEGATALATAQTELETAPEATVTSAPSEATAEATAEEATPEVTAEAAGEATAETTGEVTPEATAEATAEPTATPEVTAEPAAIEPNNGDGYLFLIQGSGRFAIMRATGRSILALVDWTPSDRINRGRAANTIRAVCVADYLAMYVNGEFMGDAIDDSYFSGQVGLGAAAASRAGMTVEFDNLSVFQATGG